MGHLEPWIQGLKAMLDMVLKHPASSLEWWVLLIAAVLTCVIVLRVTAAAFGMGRTGFAISGCGALAGLALILLALTASSLLMVTGVWLLTAAGAGISLILIIPMLCFLLKGNYLVAFFAWLISMGAVIGVIALLSAGFDTVSAGTQEAGKVKSHKQDLEQILGGQREVPVPKR
ncbi:MAG: hypothetical protein KKG09_10440 [Verrucomicrobia bacterium]|nr:hypothetical protein [Verrucomicrobiota bacterium]MBU4291648.1 hypothetical protein [Verrucomicrobiota bacterium]MBU4428472.1 hypothetical protein [Verrucomicrobiota bacterium]MBU4498410.1 hypothetical protein [Verrucomicrobiota bacterium]MCG2679045.1 hypothetical protein [Kiritimatiellia bacterium]